MSLTVFDVQFDNPQAIYYAGQAVTGRVTVQITKEKKIRGIIFRFKGETEVRWTESRTVTTNGKNQTHHDTYRSHELYFEQRFQAIGQPGGEMMLTVGEHVFPFSYPLPRNIPSSFEGSRGHVRYTFKATIDRPWKFDHELKAAFTVLTPLDLNAELNLQEPTKQMKEKTLCCCCCKQGPITMIAHLPMSGFVPGQKIAAVVELDNISNETVTVKCQLVKNVKFTASHGWSTHHKYDETVVSGERSGTVTPRGSQTWTTDIIVPSLPASRLHFCNYIDIYYKLVVKASFSGAHTGMQIDIPVVIGTIPLRELFPAMVPCAPSGPLPSPPPSFSDAIGWVPPAEPSAAPSAPLFNPYSDYPDMPPPSYEECVSGKTNIRSDDDSNHVLGPMDFVPRYPQYRFK